MLKTVPISLKPVKCRQPPPMATETLTDAPDDLREKPGSSCPQDCPGCAHRDMSAAASLECKAQWVLKKLDHWRDCIRPIQPPEPALRTGYREKVCLSSIWKGDMWRFGLVSGGRVIPVPGCPVQSARVNSALACFSVCLPPPPLLPLLYYTQSGAQVALVVKSRHMPPLTWIDRRFAEKMEAVGVEGIWIHRNPSAGRRVFAKNWWDLVWGKARSKDEDGLVYGPCAFQQLIGRLYARALVAAQSFLTPGPEDLLFDLCSGIGSSLVRWCRITGRVTGVELDGESVYCAEQNAPQAVIYRGTCRHRLPQLSEILKSCDKRRFVYINPPRTGIEEEVCRWIGAECRPERLACLSCSAGTLRRDLLKLEKEHNYRVECIIPFDFFPYTHHVECLALLRRA
ncbi:MAG: hypothetical protein R6X08_03710 [Desulfosalsimonadaceae bacterium]